MKEFSTTAVSIQSKRYMLSFNFNKNKEKGVQIGDKVLFEETL